MDHDTLRIVWFGLLGVLLAGYAILDGFDLGVGLLHMVIAKTDKHRRIVMNSIGPLWDGNEVWLITFGGALFAAFPESYASVFSGFYLAFYLLLFALILRATSMEFRSKVDNPAWRTWWDFCFFLGSGLAALLFGVAVGNLMLGLPLDERGNFLGGLLDQLNPYSICVGLMTVTMFAMHGAIFLYLKTEGDLQQRVIPWMWRTYFAFLAMYLLVTIYTFNVVPRATANFEHYPIAWVIVILNLLAIANIPRCIFHSWTGWAFISSSCVIAAMVFLLGIALFPNLVTASNEAAHTITIYSGSSSEKTLLIMLIIAVLGMPCVLAYTGVIYWTFRGKVELGEHSY